MAILKVSLPVVGLSCAACAVSVQSMLESQRGVSSASVNYGNKTVRLEYDPDITSLLSLKKITQSIGYDLFLEEEDRAEKLEALEHKRYRQLASKLLVALIFSIPVFILSMFFHHAFHFQNLLLFLLSLPVILFSGSEFYPVAARQMRHGIFSMDSLVAVGTGVAFLYSTFNALFPSVLLSRGIEPQVYFESAVIILSFILLGRFLEERARKTASSAIRRLSGLQPKTILIEREGESFNLSPALVVPGDRVMVKAGDKIPVDGKVLSGISLVDESSISGEPLPVAKSTGDTVLAGTINLQGVLVIESTARGNETLLSRIIKMVDDAQATKPPVQKLVDKITQVFVPTVFGIAALTFVIWLFAGTLSQAVVVTISVLIIACPCALGLATPTALIAGISRGASEGILIRNALVLETANTINAVLFDKTGTITEGKPEVEKLDWLQKQPPEALSCLFAMETGSNHPVALSILAYIRKHNPETIENMSTPDRMEEIPGNGIEADFAGVTWYAGSLTFIRSKSVGLSEGKPDESTNTSVYLARENEIIARISLGDRIRETAGTVVARLQEMRIKVALVTGDQKNTAVSVADKLGIDKVFADVLPDMKGTIVKDLQKSSHKVAMVGDGINDAYALAQADLGIAMGNGTDIAAESAGIVLVRPDLRNVEKALRLSQAVVKIIRQNLFWAFIYNFAAIPLAAGILYPVTGLLMNPMIAGVAMALSSVSVVTNSIRLRTLKFV
jgi:Cu2+-exporting ATPase